MSRAGKLLVPLLLAQGAMSAEEHACSVDADCDSWEADSPGPILNGVAGCVDDGEYGCQAGRWMNRSCQRGRCMWEPSCRKDHDCIITQICNEDRRCVPGVQVGSSPVCSVSAGHKSIIWGIMEPILRPGIKA